MFAFGFGIRAFSGFLWCSHRSGAVLRFHVLSVFVFLLRCRCFSVLFLGILVWGANVDPDGDDNDLDEAC